jgi:hypothetical protein
MRSNMRCLGTAMVCDVPELGDGVANEDLGKAWRASADSRGQASHFFELPAPRPRPPSINQLTFRQHVVAKARRRLQSLW